MRVGTREFRKELTLSFAVNSLPVDHAPFDPANFSVTAPSGALLFWQERNLHSRSEPIAGPTVAHSRPRTKADTPIPVCSDRWTSAEAHTPISIRSGPIGHPQRTGSARIGVGHPSDRPPWSDIRHPRRHRLGVGHNRCNGGLAVAHARDVRRERVGWRDGRVTRWAVVGAH